MYYQRGDYDEVLRIRSEEELPVYERIGDVRSAAITWGQIADVYYQRGDYDEVLRIRSEEELRCTSGWVTLARPRSRGGRLRMCITSVGIMTRCCGSVAKRRLPVYERLGDARSTAIAWGKIADVYYQRGDYDEGVADP